MSKTSKYVVKAAIVVCMGHEGYVNNGGGLGAQSMSVHALKASTKFGDECEGTSECAGEYICKESVRNPNPMGVTKKCLSSKPAGKKGEWCERPMTNDNSINKLQTETNDNPSNKLQTEQRECEADYKDESGRFINLGCKETSGETNSGETNTKLCQDLLEPGQNGEWCERKTNCPSPTRRCAPGLECVDVKESSSLYKKLCQKGEQEKSKGPETVTKTSKGLGKKTRGKKGKVRGEKGSSSIRAFQQLSFLSISGLVAFVLTTLP